MPHKTGPTAIHNISRVEEVLNHHFIRGLLENNEFLIELGDLQDVDLTGLADGFIIRFNATSGKFEVQPLAGGGGGGLVWQPQENSIVDALLISSRELILSQVPAANSVFVNWNGLMLGLVDDFTVSSNIISFAPQVDLEFTIGDSLRMRFQA